ncbi:XRE family transcriptional regulator [Stenotrophomonas maltophilia]|uniref:helix-turn-helix transcriptional regulator n=1 Tax=Stenotrophomonas maltophilia TaxID=40324 RepID=UPI0015DF64C9|nr:XRE family transcriptional regulator [Stenotrophomonas maltophilia]
MHQDLTPFVGEVIRQLRAEAGLNQEEAADLALVDRSYWSAVERGARANPSIKTLQKFASVFGVGLDDVFARARLIQQKRTAS